MSEAGAAQGVRRPITSLSWKLLGAFLLLAVLPLAAVELYVSMQFERLRATADSTSRAYEREAEQIAQHVADFLHGCVGDLHELASLERSEQAYLAFSENHQRPVWVRSGTNERPLEERAQVPTYKEIAFIDPQGQEQVLIMRGRVATAERRRNVADPSRTTYKDEHYFAAAAALPAGGVYVSHLTGFHVNKIEQLGVENLLPRLKNKDQRTKQIYRYLLLELLRAAGAMEFVSSFREGDHDVLVYRRGGDSGRVLVDEPTGVTAEQLQARELELRELIEQLAPEDVVEGARYDGVIRFATPVHGPDGALQGVVVLALDHLHLLQFTQHVKAMEENATVFAGYRDADYTYLFDDEGWIITHPKLWNIRGLDSTGKPLPALTEKTSRTASLVGRAPVNLLQLDWKMGEGYNAVVHETRAGRTGIATSDNLTGVLRTRVYSPVFFAEGEYARYGIFGGVMLGTRVDKFIELLRRMNARIAEQTAGIRRAIYLPLLVVLLLVVALAALFSRSLVRPLRALQAAAARIGAGELDTPIPQGRRDEIGELARSLGDMTSSLKATIEQLEHRAAELKQTQQRLLQAERDKQRALQAEVADLQREVARASFSQMIAVSPPMLKIQEEIVRVAASSASVLILGENGTGKELVAEAIHRNSPRRDKPFLRVNCAAFNENLLESELFGHTKGAYTGATSDRKGLFVAADGGTLLLDEVGDMSPAMQKKLLRVLQESEIVPLGSTHMVRVDVRIIAATNRDLQALMREGMFREDLYHRIHVIAIRVPPLRERREDILPLVHLFLQKYADKEKKPIPLLDPQAEKFLQEYRWPGNVREVENAVERAVIRSRSRLLQIEDFQLAVDERDLPVVVKGVEQAMTLEEVEKAFILSVLDRNAGNKKLTAKQLDIGYNTLWRKLKRYGRE